MIGIILSLVSPFSPQRPNGWIKAFFLFFTFLSFNFAMEFRELNVMGLFFCSLGAHSRLVTDKWLNLRKVKICKRGLTNLRTDINNELRRVNETLDGMENKKMLPFFEYSSMSELNKFDLLCKVCVCYCLVEMRTKWNERKYGDYLGIRWSVLVEML